LIYLTANITSNEKKGFADLILEYGLYNEGWILDKIDVNYGGEHSGLVFEFDDKILLNDEELKDIISEKYGDIITDISIAEHMTSDSMDSYRVLAKSNHKYANLDLDLTINRDFNKKSGEWSMPYIIEDNTKENWNLNGFYDEYYDDSFSNEHIYQRTVTFSGYFPNNLIINTCYPDGSSGDHDITITRVSDRSFEDAISNTLIRIDNRSNSPSDWAHSNLSSGNYTAILEDENGAPLDKPMYVLSSMDFLGPKVMFIGLDYVAQSVKDVSDDYNHEIHVIVQKKDLDTSNTTSLAE